MNMNEVRTLPSTAQRPSSLPMTASLLPACLGSAKGMRCMLQSPQPDAASIPVACTIVDKHA